MSYNQQLQNNNNELVSMLETVNNLPSFNGGSSTVKITLINAPSTQAVKGFGKIGNVLILNSAQSYDIRGGVIQNNSSMHTITVITGEYTQYGGTLYCFLSDGTISIDSSTSGGGGM